MKTLVWLTVLVCIVGAFVAFIKTDWGAVAERAQAKVDRLERVKTCKEQRDIEVCREVCSDPPSGLDVDLCWKGVRLLERERDLKAEMRVTCQRISPQKRPAQCREYY